MKRDKVRGASAGAYDPIQLGGRVARVAAGGAGIRLAVVEKAPA
jgi:hypothetical protein